MAYASPFAVPSGVKLTPEDQRLLELMHRRGFVRYREEPCMLNSRIPSRIYISGREDLTDHPELEWYMGIKIAEAVADYHHNHAKSWPDAVKSACLIGLPTAGTALAQAAAMAAHQCRTTMPGGGRICHRIMREAKKAHGAHQGWVNGAYTPELAFWGVDNAATCGQTIIDGVERLTEDGYPALDMPWLIFIDRQQGAVGRLQRLGFKRIVVVFNLLDLTYALGELKLWPRETAEAVVEEIRAHQFS